MHAGVDTGELVLVLDAETDRLLDGEAQDPGDDEGVDQDTEGCDRLHRELLEAAAEEQTRLGCEEAEVQRSDDTTDEVDADADLVIYNYVCRWQAPGIAASARAGKGVLIMKALGGQWISWADKTQTDWSQVDEAKVEELSPRGEGIRGELPLVYPIVSGPWNELAEPGEQVPRTERAIRWVLATAGVHSALVAFASVEELEKGLGVMEGAAVR